MLYHAQNGTIKLDDGEIDYVCYGTGDKIMIMLPGLGDALRSIKGTALPFALAYHKHSADYKVYMFSRKRPLTEGYSIRDMAADQSKAMKALGITQADIMGVSQGGMISQYLAIDYPELVRKLVLVVTTSHLGETERSSIEYWITLAKEANYAEIMLDTTYKSYSDAYLQKHKHLIPLLGKIGKPKDFSRFLIQAHACLNHDSRSELHNITCPTLIVGGNCDQIVGPDSSPELAKQIPGSSLIIYDSLGHALYEEATDFFPKVLDFLFSQ